LRQLSFMCQGANCPVESSDLIAPVGTHLLQCLTCMEARPDRLFATFCYRDYRVTGDSERKEGARHPTTICISCFKGYVEREIATAKLFVKCPCCPRALQTRELRGVVKNDMYMQLVRRIAAAEQAHGDDDDETIRLAKKLDLRRCPQCNTIIEKNEGCSSMACYLCGHTFRWSDAKRVKKAKKKKQQVAAVEEGIPEGDPSRVSLLDDTDSDSDDSDPGPPRLQPAPVEERSCVVM
jgi:hypothetical protein